MALLTLNESPSGERPAHRLVDIWLTAVVAVGIPALAISFYRAAHTGWRPIMLLHAALYLVALAVYWRRDRRSHLFKSMLLLGILMVAGLAGLLTYGLSGLGLMCLMIAGLMVTVTHGLRSGS